MWYFNDKKFEPTHDELSSWVGFVYELEDKSNGKKYIGKKLLWSKRRLPPLKGKKRKRTQIKESGWKDYRMLRYGFSMANGLGYYGLQPFGF